MRLHTALNWMWGKKVLDYKDGIRTKGNFHLPFDVSDNKQKLKVVIRHVPKCLGKIQVVCEWGILYIIPVCTSIYLCIMYTHGQLLRCPPPKKTGGTPNSCFY